MASISSKLLVLHGSTFTGVLPCRRTKTNTFPEAGSDLRRKWFKYKIRDGHKPPIWGFTPVRPMAAHMFCSLTPHLYWQAPTQRQHPEPAGQGSCDTVSEGAPAGWGRMPNCRTPEWTSAEPARTAISCPSLLKVDKISNCTWLPITLSPFIWN